MTENILWYIVFVFSATIHEAAHAWAALKGGDKTAYLGGQVSLDPLPHIRREPFGMVVIPVITLAFMGWPLGYASAPYDPQWEWRYPKRAGWMALAGPASNFLVVIIVSLIFIAGLQSGFFQTPNNVIELERIVISEASPFTQKLTMMLCMLFTLNLVLAVFNMLPLPPLDGATVLALILPPNNFRKFSEFVRHPQFALFGMFLAWMIFPKLFSPIFQLIVLFIYQWA